MHRLTNGPQPCDVTGLRIEETAPVTELYIAIFSDYFAAQEVPIALQVQILNCASKCRNTTIGSFKRLINIQAPL